MRVRGLYQRVIWERERMENASRRLWGNWTGPEGVCKNWLRGGAPRGTAEGARTVRKKRKREGGIADRK